MHLNFSPVRADHGLALTRDGDAVIVNGQRFDFANLPEGDELPAEAIVSDFIAGPVRREDGELHLSLILPHGKNAPKATKFPEPITVKNDGPIALPPFDVVTDDEGNQQEVHGEALSVTSGGAIDWSHMVTAEDKAAAALKEWREGASINRATFAILAATYGYITEDEAEKWASGTALPQFVADIIAASVPPEMRLTRRIMALTQPTIGRHSELIPAIAEAKGLTEEQVDEMFGWQG